MHVRSSHISVISLLHACRLGDRARPGRLGLRHSKQGERAGVGHK